MKNLKKWTRPENYAGSQYPNYYLGLSQHRDSDVLKRTNFTVLLDRLGGESKCECDPDQDCSCPVIVTRASHWAVGWIETILVHKSAADKLEILSKARESLEDYPILDDDEYSAAVQQELEEQFDSYKDEYVREICEFLGCKVPGSTTKAYSHLESLAAELLHASEGYSGLENAWVASENIPTLIRQLEYSGLESNPYYKRCKAKAKKSA